ncbi:pyridoxal phosphate-dependent transferase [Aspergillus falconensis]
MLHSLRQIQDAASNVSKLRSFLARLESSNRPGEPAVDADDVFLYPNGMYAVCSLSESLAGTDSTVAVWLYPETVNVLRRGSWGRCVSHKLGNEEELQCLEEALRSGQQIRALSCELPSNILLSSPDLHRLRELTDRNGFIVVCDDTVAGFVNLDALLLVDIMVSSMTKTFSGASLVTGEGTTISITILVLSPSSYHHHHQNPQNRPGHIPLQIPHQVLSLDA